MTTPPTLRGGTDTAGAPPNPRWAGLRRLDTATGTLLCAYGALIAKLFLALVTAGTNDVGMYQRIGEFIRAHGHGTMYDAETAFGASRTAMPPLFAGYCFLIAPLQSFPFWIRLPGILADLVAIKALIGMNQRHRLVPWWGLTLLAASPVSLLVSGYHGNIDSVMTMFVVLAVVAILDDRPVACGVWMALALNVKIAAALLLPMLVMMWWRRGRARSFVAPTVAVTLLGWAPALVVAPRDFLSQMFGYSSQWGSWGITYFAEQLGGASFQAPTEFEQMTSVESAIAAILKLAIVVGALWLVWRWRDADVRGVWQAAALTWALFFALAPGIGPQYLVWIAPFVLVASPGGYLVVTAACAVSLVAVYGVTSQWGFEFSHFTDTGRDQWLPWLAIAWVSIVGWGLAATRGEITSSPDPDR